VRLKEAVDAITQETKGQVAISLFPNNQLGSDTDMMTQLRSGALELATMPSTVLSTLIPTASLTGVGFAFTSYDKVWAAMDGEVGSFIRRNIEKAGLFPFASVWDNGFRQITSSTHPINKPEDLANFKIRVPVVPLWVAMFSAFGAAPVSIPLNEAYSALQTKNLEGRPAGSPAGNSEAVQCRRHQAARRYRPGQRRLPEGPGIQRSDLQHHAAGRFPGGAFQDLIL
jgi:TRAP-type C4-dicarboxylate transport system substrate-binding protein